MKPDSESSIVAESASAPVPPDASAVTNSAQRLSDFTPRLRSFLRRRVRCTATADDLAQETLVRAWQKLPELRDGQKLEAWLYRMARNLLIDHLRRERPKIEVAAETLVAEPTKSIDEVGRCVARAAQCYLATLPAIYQDAVRLAEEEGWSHAEVARELGISLTAAKSRIRRGRQLVREKLEVCCRLEFDVRGRVVDFTLRRPCCSARP